MTAARPGWDKSSGSGSVYPYDRQRPHLLAMSCPSITQAEEFLWYWQINETGANWTPDVLLWSQRDKLTKGSWTQQSELRYSTCNWTPPTSATPWLTNLQHCFMFILSNIFPNSFSRIYLEIIRKQISAWNRNSTAKMIFNRSFLDQLQVMLYEKKYENICYLHKMFSPTLQTQFNPRIICMKNSWVKE